MATRLSLNPIPNTGAHKTPCFAAPAAVSNARQTNICKAAPQHSGEVHSAAAKAAVASTSALVITTLSSPALASPNPPVSAEAAQQALQQVLRQSEQVLSQLEGVAALEQAAAKGAADLAQGAARASETLNAVSDAVLQASGEVSQAAAQASGELTTTLEQALVQATPTVEGLSGAVGQAAVSAADALEGLGTGIASAAGSTGSVLGAALDSASAGMTSGAAGIEAGITAGVVATRGQVLQASGTVGEALARVADVLQRAGQELGGAFSGALEATQGGAQGVAAVLAAKGGQVGAALAARGGEMSSALAAKGGEVSSALAAKGGEVGAALAAKGGGALGGDVGSVMQQAAERASAFVQEQPVQAAAAGAAVTLAAVGSTFFLTRGSSSNTTSTAPPPAGTPPPAAAQPPSSSAALSQEAVQMSQELASTVLGYEQQLAKVRAQADRARTTAAQLQRERDEAQRALEVERTTLLAMRQDAENATQQLEAELARLREKGETVVGRALDDAALQAALAEEQSRVYVAEARAEEAAYELEQERAKFMRFHKEATAALEMLEAERQRSTQLETANRELQMLLQQAAQLQAEREAQPGNEGLVRQLQEKVAELAEANERMRMALERANAQQPDAGRSEAQQQAVAATAQLQEEVARLRTELEAEKLVSHQAGVQAVQAQRSMELIMASSAELMQKLEASQAVEGSLQAALADTESRLRDAQAEAERQRERNANLMSQVDASADKAMAAITLLQQESQTIIEGQTAVIAQLTQERDDALARLADAEAQLEAERSAVQGLKEEVRAAKKALLTSFNDITALQGELGVARDAASDIKQQVDMLTDQISDAEFSLARQVSAHLAANGKVQRLRNEAEELRDELEQLAAQLMNQEEISIEVQERICLMRDAYALTVDRLEAEQSVAISVKHEVERSKGVLQQLQQQAAVLRTEMDMKEQVLTEVMLEASQQLGATEGRLREAEERLGRSNEELALAAGQLEEVGQNTDVGNPLLRKQAAAVVSKLQGVINGVRQEMTVLQEETVRARAELTSEREARLAAEQQLQDASVTYASKLQDEQAHRQTLEHRLRGLQHEYWAVKATLGAPQMQDAERLAAASVPKKVRVSEQVLRSKNSGEGLLTPAPEEEEGGGSVQEENGRERVSVQQEGGASTSTG